MHTVAHANLHLSLVHVMSKAQYFDASAFVISEFDILRSGQYPSDCQERSAIDKYMGRPFARYTLVHSLGLSVSLRLSIRHAVRTTGTMDICPATHAGGANTTSISLVGRPKGKQAKVSFLTGLGIRVTRGICFHTLSKPFHFTKQF